MDVERDGGLGLEERAEEAESAVVPAEVGPLFERRARGHDLDDRLAHVLARGPFGLAFRRRGRSADGYHRCDGQRGSVGLDVLDVESVVGPTSSAILREPC